MSDTVQDLMELLFNEDHMCDECEHTLYDEEV